MSLVLWLVFAALTAVAVFIVLRPLLSPADSSVSADSAGGAIYRDQLREVDRDIERNVIEPEEADALRADIGRRLLAEEARRVEEGGHPAQTRNLRPWAIGLLLFVPVFSLSFYVWQGEPSMPDQPMAQRVATPVEKLPFFEIIARIELRLKEEPEDVRGWTLIAPLYMQSARYEEAITAYGTIMQLEGRNANSLAGIAEALTLASGGEVLPGARQALRAALAIEPENHRARFYLALGDAQEGK
ncbi:MAG: c-type cytochrome biogenesis protein CcmI, partial [Parvibaculaceae bacterium]|nr:c-type cytochrome biogenesis protein CcmI [Parvibaculaceae bacterium]